MSHRFKLEQIADVYKRFDQKEAGIEKVFLVLFSFKLQTSERVLWHCSAVSRALNNDAD